MVGTGFCQTRQSILYFGTDDEMSDDEIRTEAHPCIPATNVEPGTVGQRRVEQTGDIKSPVQRHLSSTYKCNFLGADNKQ